jgi:hypothetical protein
MTMHNPTDEEMESAQAEFDEMWDGLTDEQKREYAEAIMGQGYEFEGGLSAWVGKHNTVIIADDPNEVKYVFAGFPNEKDAEEFILFGDFEPPYLNEFTTTTKKNYEISRTELRQ